MRCAVSHREGLKNILLVHVEQGGRLAFPVPVLRSHEANGPFGHVWSYGRVRPVQCDARLGDTEQIQADRAGTQRNGLKNENVSDTTSLSAVSLGSGVILSFCG